MKQSSATYHKVSLFKSPDWLGKR